ncbi:MAG: hypothetical protein ABF990_07975 [Acetobacter sp.]|uniref:hypothetical protein n=1 Tax=Acetobacter sp. TaxID=440 RepID=UPI0039EA53DA
MPHHLVPAFRQLFRPALPGVAALGLLSALSGCGPDQNASMSFAPACPITHVPGEAADYYLYNGKSTSFPDLVARASIVKLQGDCQPGGPKDLKTRLVLRMTVERGAAAGSTVTLPWFIAVLHGDRIVNKHVFKHVVTFPPNISTFSEETRLVTVDLPIPPRNVDSDYRFEVGFQLTKEQLQYNQDHLRRPSWQSY